MSWNFPYLVSPPPESVLSGQLPAKCGDVEIAFINAQGFHCVGKSAFNMNIFLYPMAQPTIRFLRVTFSAKYDPV